ncbi:MAG TPA: heavy-metal-associated domain-containing protein [Ignavibacteria bacterium]|nr:heavy-metal-associated domain-containing protein [Ignavibacteria bacterium]HMQ99320.1 heavy-metal-associated domain-containing protein [Ignavibacteria bacterium]
MKTITIILALFVTITLFAEGANNGKIRTKVIPTYGMHCSGCEETVTTEIMKLNGVKSVKADHVNKTVTVKYDDKKVTLKQVKAAIVSAGYKLEE